MIAPCHAEIRVSARDVTIGGDAARSTYLLRTVRSGNPFARAAVTKSSSMICKTRFRVVYDQDPNDANAKVIIGSSMWYSTSRYHAKVPWFGAGTPIQPLVGNQWSSNPKIRMKKIPYTHGGTMNVVTESTVMPRSKTVSARRAIQRPSQIPNTAATAFATVKSVRVRGSRSPMMSATEWDPPVESIVCERPCCTGNASIVKRNDFSTNGSFRPRASTRWLYVRL